MATAKIDDEEDNDTGVLHSCEICGQSNMAEDALRRHVESAHIRYACVATQFRISSQTRMSAHF